MNKQTIRPAVKRVTAVSTRLWGLCLCVAIFSALAYLYGSTTEAAPSAAPIGDRPNQTIPPRTPPAPATTVPTVTPTSTAPAPTATATATAVPSGPTATSQPGAPTATQTPDNTPTTQPTETPVPGFSLLGQMGLTSSRTMQGEGVEIRLSITNPGTEAARNVIVRDEVPAALEVVSVDAAGGTVSTEAGSNGKTIVTISWPSLAPGAEITASLVVRIDAGLADGVVIDNLAVAYADNAGPVTIGVSLGTPPLLLPTFN